MKLPVLLAFAAASVALAQPAVLEHDGWKLTAGAGAVKIEHSRLGAVVENAAPAPVRTWSASVEGNRLVLRTTAPRGAWVFEPSGDTLRISATTAEAFLKARAPAPAARIVARLVDKQGTPVAWEGTEEAKGTYGGAVVSNPSFLPRRNPDCMYFSLGAASGAGFHSLFDRKTDTAIDFPEDTRMARNGDALDVTIPVPGNAMIRILPDYYTKTLGAPRYEPFDDTRFKAAPLVWCSWTSYYSQVTEKDMVENADWLARLVPYGFEYVQLDDGYDRSKPNGHAWIENWNKETFPHGPEWLTKYIKSKGLHPGIWLVPNSYAGYADEHPDWYLHDKQGRLLRDYDTPALDSTNPNAQAFLKKLFTTLRGWGFEYYKFDGEHALPKYAPPVDQTKLYDRNIDPLEAYQQRIKLIRDTVGPDTFIEGCQAGAPLNFIGTYNSAFTGQDVYPNWQGMYSMFSSIGGNAFLNHMLIYVMPAEGIEVGPWMAPAEAAKKRPSEVLRVMASREKPVTGVGVTLPEARTLVSQVSLTGVVYSIASVLKELTPERTDLLKATMPTVPILPMDLFSRGTDTRWTTFRNTNPDELIHNYPEILDVKVNAKSGVYDVVALTNWRSEPTTRTVDFAAKLGLDPKASYAVFDFWQRKVLGAHKGSIRVDIAPHDTRVLLVHRLEGRPQLVGISRHITGAFSVSDLAWSGKALRGVAETVAGDPYAVWLYVPDGYKPAKVEATSAGRPLEVEQRLEGHSLMLRFPGQGQPVAWSAQF